MVQTQKRSKKVDRTNNLIHGLMKRGDLWMIRTLYAIKLLKQAGIEADHILKMTKAELYEALESDPNTQKQTHP